MSFFRSWVLLFLLLFLVLCSLPPSPAFSSFSVLNSFSFLGGSVFYICFSFIVLFYFFFLYCCVLSSLLCCIIIFLVSSLVYFPSSLSILFCLVFYLICVHFCCLHLVHFLLLDCLFSSLFSTSPSSSHFIQFYDPLYYILVIFPAHPLPPLSFSSSVSLHKCTSRFPALPRFSTIFPV